MNNQRRKELEKIIARIEDVRSEIEEIKDAIEMVRDEEEVAYDNLPESIQDSDRGQAMQDAINALDYVDLDFDFDDAIDNIREAIDC